MKLQIDKGVPLVSVTIIHQGNRVDLERVVLDTGSATSIFKKELLSQHGIHQERDDNAAIVTGIGGTESVVIKTVDEVHVGNLRLSNYEIDLGKMDYAKDIDGLLGFDFLYRAYAVIDCDKMQLRSS